MVCYLAGGAVLQAEGDYDYRDVQDHKGEREDTVLGCRCGADDQDAGEKLEEHAHDGACEDDGCADSHLFQGIVYDVGHGVVEGVRG